MKVGDLSFVRAPLDGAINEGAGGAVVSDAVCVPDNTVGAGFVAVAVVGAYGFAALAVSVLGTGLVARAVVGT